VHGSPAITYCSWKAIDKKGKYEISVDMHGQSALAEVQANIQMSHDRIFAERKCLCNGSEAHSLAVFAA